MGDFGSLLHHCGGLLHLLDEQAVVVDLEFLLQLSRRQFSLRKSLLGVSALCLQLPSGEYLFEHVLLTEILDNCKG